MTAHALATLVALGDISVSSEKSRAYARRVVSLEAPGPEDLPRLWPQLQKCPNIHIHKDDETITVHAHAQTARATPEEERTADQVQLLHDIQFLKRFAPGAVLYDEIYTPAELRAIVAQLEPLQVKNVRGFSAVGAEVLDVLAGSQRGLIPDELLISARRKLDRGIGKWPTQWDSFSKAASHARGVLDDGFKTQALDAYNIVVTDPERYTQPPDLTPVYQFVVTNEVMKIIGQRSATIHESQLTAFVKNCIVINRWMLANSGVIDRIPNVPARPGEASARWQLDHLVHLMNQRLGSDEHFGQLKGYVFDTRGAIKLQGAIGAHASNIVKMLRTYNKPDRKKIVPLD